MTQNSNLKELEKKAWTSTFQDGIMDIGIGLILVVTTICQTFDAARFYPYSLTIADTGVIASGAYAWLISGIIMIVIGVVYLVRFLRKYPLPVKGVYHDSTN